jgi:hypothetical protein
MSEPKINMASEPGSGTAASAASVPVGNAR